jgi:hypothetical protein
MTINIFTPSKQNSRFFVQLLSFGLTQKKQKVKTSLKFLVFYGLD